MQASCSAELTEPGTAMTKSDCGKATALDVERPETGSASTEAPANNISGLFGAAIRVCLEGRWHARLMHVRCMCDASRRVAMH